MLTPIAQLHSGLAERLGLAGGASPEVGTNGRDHALSKQAARHALATETTSSGDERSIVQRLGSSLERFDQAAKQIVGKAVDVLQDDFGALLEDLGFDGDTAQALLSSLLQPLRQVLESGADFTAQVSLLAVQQQTVVAGNSFSQDLQLVAKSLEIDVNHSTGEISIGLTSLSIEQSVSGRFGGPGLGFAGGAAPALPIGGDFGGGDLFGEDLFGEDLADFIGDLLDRVGAPEAGDEEAEPQLDDGDLIEALEPADLVGDNLDDEDEVSSAPEAEAAADGQTARVDSRTRFTIQAVERFENDLGQAITRLRLDASVRFAALSDVPVREDTGRIESDRRGAGARVLDLKI